MPKDTQSPQPIHTSNTATVEYKFFSEDIDLEDIEELISDLLDNKKLIKLSLISNKIEEQTISALAKALKKNKTLTHLVFKINTILAINKEKARPYINPRFCNALLAAISEKVQLIELDLACNGLNDDDVIILANVLRDNTSLITLKINNNKISDAGLRILLDACKNKKNLAVINLADNLISDHGAIALANALKEYNALANLIISGNQISDAGITVLLNTLKENRNLKKLTLSCNLSNQAVVNALAELLNQNKTLAELGLQESIIKDKHAKALNNLLRNNNTLTSLNLHFTYIGHEEQSYKTIKYIATFLKNNRSLYKLDLSDNFIDDEGAIALANALKINNTLRELILNSNFIDKIGLQALADSLKTNSTLTRLDILNNDPLDENEDKNIYKQVQQKIMLNRQRAESASQAVQENISPITDNTIEHMQDDAPPADNLFKNNSSFDKETCYNNGLIFKKQGDYIKAIIYFDKALTLDPDYQTAKDNKKALTDYLKSYKKIEHMIDTHQQLDDNPVLELVCKLLTSLIYENKRHRLQDKPCLDIIKFLSVLEKQLLYDSFRMNDFLKEIFHYIKTLIENNASVLPADLEKLLKKQEEESKTYFGSFLSDCSDSEEENQANKVPKDRDFKNHKAKVLIDSIKDNRPVTTENKLYKKKVNKQMPSEKHSPSRWKINTANIDEQHFNELEKLNDLLKKGFSPAEAATQIEKSFYVAHFRGISYYIHKWNKLARKNHRDKSSNNEIGNPQYSTSVYKAAGAYPYSDFFKKDASTREKYSETLRQNAVELEKRLLDMRRTKPCVEKTATGKNYLFRSNAHALQNLYTKDYNKFHQFIKQNKFDGALLNDENPEVSTSFVPNHSLKYAYGTKCYKSGKKFRLKPRWRKDGRAERPYSGKVYISLHPIAEYDEQGPFHIPMLSKQGELSPDILVEILHEREASFPAWIKDDRVIEQHIAKYPSFNGEYKAIYLYKYGLTKDLYDKFKEAINNSAPHSNERRWYKDLLADWLCCYHEVRLIEIARLAAEKKGGRLVYYNQDGSFGLEPDEPTVIGSFSGEKNKQSREQMSEIQQFRSEFAKILTKAKQQDIQFIEAEKLFLEKVKLDKDFGRYSAHFYKLFNKSAPSSKTNNIGNSTVKQDIDSLTENLSHVAIQKK